MKKALSNILFVLAVALMLAVSIWTLFQYRPVDTKTREIAVPAGLSSHPAEFYDEVEK